MEQISVLGILVVMPERNVEDYNINLKFSVPRISRFGYSHIIFVQNTLIL